MPIRREMRLSLLLKLSTVKLSPPGESLAFSSWYSEHLSLVLKIYHTYREYRKVSRSKEVSFNKAHLFLLRPPSALFVHVAPFPSQFNRSLMRPSHHLPVRPPLRPRTAAQKDCGTWYKSPYTTVVSNRGAFPTFLAGGRKGILSPTFCSQKEKIISRYE